MYYKDCTLGFHAVPTYLWHYLIEFSKRMSILKQPIVVSVKMQVSIITKYVLASILRSYSKIL